MEFGNRQGFGFKIHGGIAVVPIAHDAQTLEFFALNVDPAGGIVATGLAEFRCRDFVFLAALGAILLFDLPFDG